MHLALVCVCKLSSYKTTTPASIQRAKLTANIHNLCAHPVLLFDAKTGIQGDPVNHTGLQMGLQACEDL